MRMSYEVEEFLEHSDHCAEPGEGLLDEDWDEQVDIAVRVHLLDRWLREDSPDAPSVFADLRIAELDPDALLESGLFQVIAPGSDLEREPREYHALTAAEAAATVEQAVLAAGGPPSPRVALLADDLRTIIAEQAGEAALVTAVDPATGAVADGETHVVLAWGALSAVIRISVLPHHPDDALDPVCAFAMCPDGVTLDPVERRRSAARLRAVCAGTVLAFHLECDGRAAFRVGWRPHDIDSGDFAAVRAWWETTGWHEQYEEDYVDVYYDYGAGDWGGHHSHMMPPATQMADEDDDPFKDSLVLGDPAAPVDSIWLLGGQLNHLSREVFEAELEALRQACRAQAMAGELADHLLNELLTVPLGLVAGQEDRLAVWADADDGGAFWRGGGDTIDLYGEARRLLVVGPREALYIVFKGEMGA
ncbi:hypothetical protein ACFOY2_37390 [Nonomuraea purpurea]|uniref:DUF1963 domain-containing protein n=1 Tax=Nonomuraea purpurea TaxID=1849276 RepID=A0ABV8GJU2_9ACTN